MHTYTIDTKKREQVIRACAAWSVIVGILIEGAAMAIAHAAFFQPVYSLFDEKQRNLFWLALTFLLPLSSYGFWYWLYCWKGWKLFFLWHRIPDLNGTWKMTVKSPLKKGEPTGMAYIKQDWTKILITTVSVKGTEVNSDMASIEGTGTETFLKYAYTVRRSAVSYPGYNKLVFRNVNGTCILEGDYFSAKPLQIKIGSRKAKVCSSQPNTETLEVELSEEEISKGTGSKGTIRFEKISRNIERG